MPQAETDAGKQKKLVLNGLSRYFDVRRGLFGQKRRLVAVDNVSISVASGESLGLVGESGCGKSTLGKMACGLLPPSAGRVLFAGRNLPPAGAGSWAAGRLQMIFQDPFSSLNPRIRVGASVSEPLAARGVDRRQRESRTEEMLAMVGLAGMGRRYPHEFSGGQRQRIAVARALVTRPDVVICDEPVSALDASVQAQILNLLRDMQERFSPAYLFISHDLSVVGFMCRRICVMYLGRIVEEAPAGTFFAHAAHPYSRMLLAAMPGEPDALAPDGAAHRGGWDAAPPLPDQRVAGDILPSPLAPPSGCHFHPRCPLAADVCRTAMPAWRELAPGWRVRCHQAR